MASATFRNKQKQLLSDEKHLGQRARRGAAVGLINQPAIEALPVTDADTQQPG